MGKYPESITVKKTGVVLGVSALALTGVLSHKDKQPKTMVDQLNKPKVIETAFIKKRRPTYHFLHSLGGVAGTGFSKRQVPLVEPPTFTMEIITITLPLMVLHGTAYRE